MNNSNYNSLAQQLMQNGILPNNEQKSDKNNNFFEVAFNEDATDSPIERSLPSWRLR